MIARNTVLLLFYLEYGTMDNEPLIGVISDHSTSVLAGRIRAAGYRTIRVAPDKLIPGQTPPVDAWVIDCDDDSEVADAMEWIEQPVLALSNRPDLSDLAEFRGWCERIIKSLDKTTAGMRNANESEPVRSRPEAYNDVQAVWVLAGSTGGVSAVSDFLEAFTHVPPVAFVYAQHIQQDQQDMLKAVAHASGEIICDMALGRHWLNPGHLLIVPATRQLKFSSQGEVLSTRESWPSSETPNISQLILAMTGLQPSPAGAIIFSGAGVDGAEGLRALKNFGAQIWAQEPTSCAAPSMPQAAIDRGPTSRTGSPLELAAAFMELYPEPCR